MKIAIMTSLPAEGNVYVDAGHGCKHREKVEAEEEAKAEAKAEVKAEDK
jgi:uncharacterized protein (DUF1786 family)